MSLTLLHVLGAFSSCCVALPSLDKMTFAFSCCVLFCWVWFISLRGLLFSDGKQRDSVSGGEENWREIRSGEKRKCGQ